jgi:hypothetical protein
MSSSSDLRTALIAAGASIVVGIITVGTSWLTTREQLQGAELSHSNDVAQAFQRELDDLFNSDQHHVQVALAAIYFLGENTAERKQIIETAGSSESITIRDAISHLLLIDRISGPALAQDPDVEAIIVGDKAARAATTPSKPVQPGVRSTPTPLPESPARSDNLDQTAALLNGAGWAYIGVGNGDNAPPDLSFDRTIIRPAVPSKGDVITFARTVNLRNDDSAQANRIGVVQEGSEAVVLDTRTHPISNGRAAYWAQIFLCAAPPGVSRPPSANKCPSPL